MRTLVVCDMHGAYDRLCALLRQEGVIDDRRDRVDGDVRVVQIGDLLNCVRRDLLIDTKTLDYLRLIDDYIVGNHEHPYFGGGIFAGFHYDPVIASVLRAVNRSEKMKPCVAVGDILVSHAGLTIDLCAWVDAETACLDITRMWRENPRNYIFQTTGAYRGGTSGTHGGILWSDWREEKSPVFRQIVGHSPAPVIRWQVAGKKMEVTREQFNEATEEWEAICIDTMPQFDEPATGAWIEEDGSVRIVQHVVEPVRA